MEYARSSSPGRLVFLVFLTLVISLASPGDCPAVRSGGHGVSAVAFRLL